MGEKFVSAPALADAAAIRAALDNLLGIVDGIVCDNELADAEVRFLATWLDANKHVAASFPANIIARRVGEVLSDGLITEDEKIRLLTDLKTIAGSGLTESMPTLPAHVAAAFTSAPVVEIPNKLFVLTGEFVFGSRPTCERAIMKRGGSVGSSVSGRTNYVVVGGMSTPAWLEQNYPHKIRQAVDLAKSGNAKIVVIRETDWAAALL
jgi:NAD-dependent DNA ligase